MFSPSSFTAADADMLAYIAHGANGKKGQRRADGITPYIVHPRRVAALVREWIRRDFDLLPLSEQIVALCAAYLHDVFEDTGLRRADFLVLGVPERVIRVTELLTKPDDGPAPPEYYEGIAGDPTALVVKCADRCANLEDALKEVLNTNQLRRWKKYVLKTHRDVVPLYAHLPRLRAELLGRLAQIEDALESAKPELYAQLLEELKALAA